MPFSDKSQPAGPAKPDMLAIEYSEGENAAAADGAAQKSSTDRYTSVGANKVSHAMPYLEENHYSKSSNVDLL